MKQKILLVALVAVGIIATSCRKEVAFSCNPEINEWAHENLSELSQMSFSRMAEYESEEYQRTIFRTKTAEGKVKFWDEKLADVLTLPWNEAERAHIIELRNMIADNGLYWYEGAVNAKSEAERDKIDTDFELKTYRWMEYAEETLGWDRSLLYAIVATPAKVIDTEGTLMLAYEATESSSDSPATATAGTRAAAASRTCNCSLVDDWCGLSDDCERAICDKTDPTNFRGCGFFLRQECDGLCSSTNPNPNPNPSKMSAYVSGGWLVVEGGIAPYRITALTGQVVCTFTDNSVLISDYGLNGLLVLTDSNGQSIRIVI